MKLNANRLKDYVNRLVLHPKKGKYEKKPIVAEATKEQLNGPDAKFQNTHRIDDLNAISVAGYILNTFMLL